MQSVETQELPPFEEEVTPLGEAPLPAGGGMRHILMGLGIAVAFAAGGSFLALVASTPSPVTRDGYNRIRVGMTPEEVREVLGEPMWESQVPVYRQTNPCSRCSRTKVGTHQKETWTSWTANIAVVYDANGKVEKKTQRGLW